MSAADDGTTIGEAAAEYDTTLVYRFNCPPGRGVAPGVYTLFIVQGGYYVNATSGKGFYVERLTENGTARIRTSVNGKECTHIKKLEDLGVISRLGGTPPTIVDHPVEN